VVKPQPRFWFLPCGVGAVAVLFFSNVVNRGLRKMTPRRALVRTRDLWQRCVNLCTSTGSLLPRSILMRRVLFDLSLTTTVYNFFIVHFSDACFYSFCFDYFCKHVHCPRSDCKIKPILFYSIGVGPIRKFIMTIHYTKYKNVQRVINFRQLVQMYSIMWCGVLSECLTVEIINLLSFWQYVLKDNSYFFSSYFKNLKIDDR
jgi:hypothetical protein